VPAFDKDGNGIGGIRLPELEAPLGTYQGWNPRQAEFGAPDYLARFDGSFWAFATTEAQRRAAGDPRPSIEERYSSKADYFNKVRAATTKLVAQRLLLREDAEAYLDLARRMVWPPVPIDRYPFWQTESAEPSEE
jgi:hypothetical protein